MIIIPKPSEWHEPPGIPHMNKEDLLHFIHTMQTIYSSHYAHSRKKRFQRKMLQMSKIEHLLKNNSLSVDEATLKLYSILYR